MMIPHVTDALVPTGTPFMIEMTLLPGPLGVLVETSTKHCFVRSKLSKRSKLAVGDSIISVNDIAFDEIAKIEEGVRAWMHILFQEHDERKLVILRSDTAANSGDATLKVHRKSTIQEAGLAKGYLHESPATNT